MKQYYAGKTTMRFLKLLVLLFCVVVPRPCSGAILTYSFRILTNASMSIG